MTAPQRVTSAFQIVEHVATPRPVRVMGSLPGRLDHGCGSCGGSAGVRELFLSVAGWPFSAHLCPECAATVRADLT